MAVKKKLIKNRIQNNRINQIDELFFFFFIQIVLYSMAYLAIYIAGDFRRKFSEVRYISICYTS